jgi:transposase
VTASPSNKEVVMAVMIGIDPHKRSHTAVALNGTDEVLGQLRITADRRQLDRLLRFAASWPERVWAVENANGLGRLLSRQLLDAGETVVDVPAKLSARVRALSGAGHKTDAHDARSTAVAGRHGTGVTTMAADDPLLVLLDVVVERRWQLVSARQKTLCRIHDQLTCLLPGGAAKHLTADKTAALLRRIHPTDPVGIRRRLIVRELLGELRVLDRKIAPVDADIAWMLGEHGTTLTDIVGIGQTGAATILAVTGDPTRFRSAAAFASFAGTAPIAASSGDTIRHRLNRGGNRQLNKVLHTAAKTQIRLPGPGRDYYQRRRAEGKTNAEAIRALKRHITTTVYRTLQSDAAARAARRAQASEEDKRS